MAKVLRHYVDNNVNCNVEVIKVEIYTVNTELRFEAACALLPLTVFALLYPIPCCYV